MAGGTKKGKIPQNEWPKILERYRGGESIAQIGRDYGCTAPAIRYIIKRSGQLREGAARSASRQGSMGKVRAGAAKAAEAGPEVGAGADRMLAADLRKRVSGDIASFLVALDHTVVEGTIGSAVELQEATDRLMRSIARIRIELERVVAGDGPMRTMARGAKAPIAGSGRGA